ncbi:MAG: GNAT family N-acetyltransferase [Gaiellales bacterium]
MADVEIRALRPEDVEAAYGLLAEQHTADFGEIEMTAQMYANTVAIADRAYVVETERGVAGTAKLDGEDVDVLVRPSERRTGIGTALLRAVEADARTRRLQLSALASEPAAEPFARANGYEKAWEFWLMGVDLREGPHERAWPDGVEVRTFRAEDADEVKNLLDLAYADEPGHVPLTLENWKTFMLTDPSFDPEAWFLAVADGRMVGAALNWKEGYVKDLVVHPDWRRRGLGRALMEQTFAEFVRRGIGRLTLKTDSINPTEAWRLYERLGMRKERTYEVFEKRLSRRPAA